MKTVQFTKHAFLKMFERGLTPRDCEEALATATIIEVYPDDKPFPSDLRLGFVKNKPVHLVIAETLDFMHVITAYVPDPALWSLDFTKRRKGGL